MTDPEDARNYLKAKLEDRNPKCGNCKWWEAQTSLPTVGACRYSPDGRIVSAMAVTDLSLCSAWEKKQ